MKEKVFDPVVKKVMKLVETQINLSLNDQAHLDYIILSGGLGQSLYLRDQIKKMELVVKNNIKVFQPSEYNSAIVRGAVLIAKNPNVITQRIIRKTYGFEVLQPYNPEKDTIIHQETVQGGTYTKFKFDRFIEIGSSVPTYEYYEKQYYVEYPNNTYAGSHIDSFS